MSDFIEVRGILVDSEPILRLKHRCDPLLCRGNSCCEIYDAMIEPEDKKRVEQHLPPASSFLDRGTEGRRAESFFRMEGPLCFLERDSGGRCVLAYCTPDKRVLCALHSAALSTGKDPAAAKPQGCMLWPLSLSGAVKKVLSVQQGACGFPCNSFRPVPGPSLDTGTAALIRNNFGALFLSILEDELAGKHLTSG